MIYSLPYLTIVTILEQALFRPFSMEFTKAFTVRAVNELIILWFRWDVDMPTTGASSRILQGY